MWKATSWATSRSATCCPSGSDIEGTHVRPVKGSTPPRGKNRADPAATGQRPAPAGFQTLEVHQLRRI
jgi:hypothetical protein